LIVVDTSVLLAVVDRDDHHHRAASEALTIEHAPYVVSPYVLAELDYLVATRLGVTAALEVLQDMSGGAYELASFDADDVRTAAGIVEHYRDLEIGLADASIVVLAHRYRTDRVLTLDTRPFRTLRTIRGGPFTILPEGDVERGA
jgi:predicted nucleic acid-binding protein